MRVISDTGPIISLSTTCLLSVLRSLPFEILVPPSVVDELVTFPMRTKQHKFGAIRVQDVLRRGIIKTAALSRRVRDMAGEIDFLANHTFFYHHRPLRILHRGEIEALALAEDTDRVLCVDERTTREIVEDPEAIRQRLERHVHGRVTIDKEHMDELLSIVGDILIIRSVELVALAAEHGAFSKYVGELDALEAALYALKFAGCSVSEEEIKKFILEMQGLKTRRV